MTVLQFPERPSARVDDCLTCECGSAWFELVIVHPNGSSKAGAVALDNEGRVTGYAGTPHCVECGREKLP